MATNQGILDLKTEKLVDTHTKGFPLNCNKYQVGAISTALFGEP